MGSAGVVTEDRGFKGVCALYAKDAFVWFGADLIAKHGGPPATVTLVQQEVFSHDHADHSTIVDVALLGKWEDGSTDLLLLIEHHAEIRKVRPEGIAHYITSMIRRHRDTDVFPIVFVTDRSDQPIPDDFLHRVGGKQVLRAEWTVVRITADDLPRLRAMQSNKMAALLMSLIGEDSAAAVVAAMRAMIDAGFAYREIGIFLPLLMRFARMNTMDRPRFNQLLQAEIPQMRSFIDDERDQAQLGVILDMVAKRRLAAAVARAEIADLVAAGSVDQAQAELALAKLHKRSVRRTSRTLAKKQQRRR